jgi:hypothetical protein
MKITGPAGPNQVQSRGPAKRGRAGDGSFASELGGDAAATQSAASTSPSSAIDALLALQEVDDATSGRKRAIRHANDLLDRLDAIRLGLLTGSIPKDQLERLARLARDGRPQVADPQLAEILADIELRAEVELAKLGL